MQFTKIQLSDFGPYEGTTTINLKPQGKVGERPIILFGGLNGAGKTKIYEAIRLCLYGPLAVGAKTTRKGYDDHLMKKMHYSKKNGLRATSSRIVLDFDYGSLGELEHYRVSRSWSFKGKAIKESLKIQKNGEEVEDIHPDQWQDFLKELIPPGLSSLYFFDGEKIETLAEQGKVDYYVSEALKSLLGIDVVERLHLDLLTLSSRKSKLTDSKGQKVHINKLVKELESIKDKLEKNNQDLSGLKAKFDQLGATIENDELRLSSEGGGFALKRDENKAKLTELEMRIPITSDKIRQLVSETYPFSLCPTITQSLTERFETERAIEESVISDKVVMGFVRYVSRSKRDGNDDAGYQMLLNNIESDARRYLNDKHSHDGELLHNISNFDRSKLTDWITNANDDDIENMRRYSKQLEELQRQKQRINRALLRDPGDKFIGPIINRIKLNSQKRGDIQRNIINLQETERGLYAKREDIYRKLDRFENKMESITDIDHQLKLISRINNVIKKFLQDRIDNKIQELEASTLDCLKKLNRKDDIINNITIDKKTFEVVLKDQHDAEIDRSQLSAGERQIFAVSLLWGLSKTSKRPLPFIIDTPLSRLDSHHRQKFINNFFTKASDQMIILSTDTEVDKEYYDLLKPYVSKAYHLAFEESISKTMISEGYFWESGGDAS